MKSRAVRLLSLAAALSFWSVAATLARAEESDSAALAAAMKNVSATLQGGLKASEAQGIPISAKFEIEDGKLQLSIYTMKGNDFTEVRSPDRRDLQGGENHGCCRSQRGDSAEGSYGKGEGALAYRHRDGGERQCRVSCG
jgi:hypothetical protein